MPRFVANSYVNLFAPDALKIPGGTPFTIEGWVKFETVPATAMLYSKGNERKTPYTYMFGLTGTGTKMAAYTGTGGTPAETWMEAGLPAAVVKDRWYHLAYSFDGAYLSFFLDGACVGRQPFVFTDYSTHTVKIGGYSTTTDIPGNISDVRVWNQARTTAQIRHFMDRRLNGAETGLLGYWPMNEGSGTVVADGAGANNGTFSGLVTWVTAADLSLAAASPDFLQAMPFALANIATGSTRFTNSNMVNVVAMPIPDGCDNYQITHSGAVGSIAPDGWLSTNVPPAQQTFPAPATDTNFTAYAWFTNSTATALMQRAESSVFYTTVPPVPAVRAALAIQRLPGQNVIIHGTDLDAGSTGGEANGLTLAIRLYDAVCANPGDDLTPDESYATLAAEGVYPLLLRLGNEAGNAVTATTTCMVTVTASAINTNLWTGAGGNDLWHNPANWSAGVPAAGQNVTILAGSGTRLTRATAALNSFVLGASRTLTVEGWESSLKAVEMTVNGTVTHANNDVATEDWITWVPQHRILLEVSNITVAANAKLDADWKGYRRNQGPGTPAWMGSGAGHAGEGGFGNARNGGTAYGELHTPEQPGSGGGITTTYLTQSAEGGGVIRVVASGRLTVLGTIRANGRNYISTHGSGGSGGSIWIDCRTLAGTSAGLVQVNGGNGNYYGAGASAGRIALHYDPAAQRALAEPRPPIRFEGIPGDPDYRNLETFRSGMGTLSLADTLLIDGNFTAKRLRDVQVAVPGWTEWALNTLTLNDCSIGLEAGITLSVTNDVIVTNGAVLHLFAAPVTNVLTDAGATANIGGGLLIHSNSWIMPYADPTNGATVKINVGGGLYVAAGGGIDADRRGYTRGYGPGCAMTGRSDGGNGAGYGGHGGMGFGGKLWGPSYGSADWPVEAGSGAWLYTGGGSYAGRGGGSIRLHVAGGAVVHGTLTAKGSPGLSTHGGGGSGGGILLECGTLQGSNSGLLTVEGGKGNYGGSCGGGGRIAI
ncbi:MAG: LamG domain-containing protein, partial [Lentisphaerae bacterium]|nr:LamG domain-containing protein [Lentisphaerota bacterium]